MTRCKACTASPFPMIPPHGPTPCDVLVLGEGPSKDDIRQGLPFTGNLGAELNDQYLRLADLRREWVLVTNVTLCPFDAGKDPVVKGKKTKPRGTLRNPTKLEARQCAQCHLHDTLTTANPRVVVCLGAAAAGVWDRPIPLTRDHGFIAMNTYSNPWSGAKWEGMVMATYHPAAGLRSGRFMRPIQMDFQHLGRWLRGKVAGAPVDSYPDPVYFEIDTVDSLDAYLSAGDRAHEPSVDTEDDEETGEPWCVTVSVQDGTAGLIRACNGPVLRRLQEWLTSHPRPLVTLHNATHDLAPLVAMGIDPPRWDDTILWAAELNTPALSLKYLCRQHCGMRMTDYGDVVTPHSAAVLAQWLDSWVLGYDAAFGYDHTFKSGKRKGQTERRVAKITPPVFKRLATAVKTLRRKLHTQWPDLIPLAPGESEAVEPEPEPAPEPLVLDLEPESGSESESDDEDTDTDADSDTEGNGKPKAKFNPWKLIAQWEVKHPGVLNLLEGLTGSPLPRRSITRVPFPLALAYACADADGTGRLKPKLKSLIRGVRNPVV